MEAFAFIHIHVGYEDETPEPQMRSLHWPGAPAVGSAGMAIALCALSLTAPAQAVLLPGDTGAAVADVQRVLQRQGYTLRADGVYGPATRAAVVQFQQKQQLNPDGIVGPRTSEKLGLPATPPPAAPATSTVAQATTPQGKRISGYVTVTTDNLRIRSAANTDATVLGYLNNREVVPTTGRVENGFIELYRGGWISAAFTNLGAAKPGSTTPATTPAKSFKTVINAPTGLRIRSGPGAEYNVIGVLNSGERVEVTGTARDGWIQLAKGGWVSATYLQ